MNKEIFYHNNEAYLILKKIKISSLSPRQYGIDSDDHMKVLKAWMEWLGGNHVLKNNDEFWIVETIQHAEIID